MTHRNRVSEGVKEGGQFAKEQRSEDSSVRLASKPWSPPAETRYADAVLDRPLEPYEVGRRMDRSGRIAGLVPVDVDDLAGSTDERNNVLSDRLTLGGRGYLMDLDCKPRGVDSQGRILMEVSANTDDLFDRGFDDDGRAQFDQGLREPRMAALNELPEGNFANGAAWVSGDSAAWGLKPVPPLPKEIRAETFSLDFDDDGNPMASVELDSGEYLYAYARDDGYGGIETRSNAQSGEVETGLPPEVQGQTLIHLESVAYNQMAIEREAVAMLRQNKSFMSKAQQVAVAGQQ